ncbi:hypothetical protein BESB_001880 [Besnoitia besnoiti]|uniref:Ubiquitin-like domain-containing protein n=1 Tax=Besnoitia besnoiti TaxID=94643 RepID=A0A2A9MNM8_BESBE|nr:hypothetical protein BESB_001880 [Besnoitia besnoiti]PFH37846.1 hypothetical protein BESB_001880 [Besnoitia besnoiti]
MLLHHLAGTNFFASAARGARGTAPTLVKSSLTGVGGLQNAALTADGVVFDSKKKPEDYSIGPETRLYVTSVPYSMPTRLFIVYAETGETVAVEMLAADPVSVLMRLLHTRLGLEPEDLLLVHRGEVLERDHSLQEQGVASDALVYLLLKSQQPPLPPPAPVSRSPPGAQKGALAAKEAEEAKKKV